MGKSWKEKPDKFRRQLQKKQKKHKGFKPQKDSEENGEVLWKPDPMDWNY